jgi:UPF0716 protein FxsA
VNGIKGAWLAIIVLAFPVLESVGIYYVWQAIGAWTLLWLLVAMLWGMLLLSDMPRHWAGQMIAGMQGGVTPGQMLTTVGLRMFAALLLIVPGAISDVLALGMLLWSWRTPAPAAARAAVYDESIEGEFRRVDDALLPHEMTRQTGPDSVK